ncbi:MAG: hypothetical protein ACRD6X_13235 [Pyrinomonadaceae bacterium]
MWKDEIVEEVRKARDEFAAKFDYDMDAIYREIKRQEAESERKFVSFPPKRIKPTENLTTIS